MQDTVNQVHGAVPRALADIVGVIGVSPWPTACRVVGVPTPLHVPHGRFLPRYGAVMLALARTTHARASGWHWHWQLHWIPGTMSAMSTTTIRTLTCALPVTLG